MVITRALMEGEVDDDGRAKRTGNSLTATTHIITVVIGAGVLALAYAMAQLGWIAGIATMIAFAVISTFTYNLVADCYRFPDPITGKRNYTYMQAVKAYLGGTMYVFCGLVQYTKLAGITVGYTITSATSLVGLSLSVVISGKGQPTSITGTRIGPELSAEDKVWRVFSSLGNIALAANYSTVIFDIMDTLKSDPPENKQMKKANVMGVTAMTILFLLCSGFGYAAFGDHTPGNILTGFYEPFWLVALGNTFVVIHMVGAYQVMAQPFYRIVEMGANMVWPESDFINKEYPTKLGNIRFNFNLFRLIWRTIFVILSTILAMAMPFFNEILSLLGAIGFWPLVVFFPIQMHIRQRQIKKRTLKWCMLQLLSFMCFIVTVTAVVGSVHGISKDLHKYKVFTYRQ
ncbi:amino acid permease 8 isoform X2 [Arachis duranensis]|uniref:Amino acid permease 8 isoform X2 n=1 Tax=Arachis duranensis TaxID=130453 RepID=A0A9C6TQT4_ARADU|nr:amino acid permease 8 isoform X2 [Arachis duranensis]